MKDFLRKSREEQVLLEQYRNGIRYLQFPSICKIEGVKHLFSTRIGGCSKGYLGSMNLSYLRGDEKENVDENYKRIAELLSCSLNDFVLSDQTHTTNIRIVTKEDCGKGITREKDYRDIDGLITAEKGIVLVTSFADCVPLFFVDPCKRVIGLSHSGWRGTVGRIGQRTIQLMQQTYGCNPADIIAAIGPSICKDCYEVDQDVAEQFLEEFKDSRNAAQIVEKKEHDKFKLDLWKANETVLLDAGIRPENLSVTDICTCCNPDLLFSHRASHGKRGNLSAFLMLD